MLSRHVCWSRGKRWRLIGQETNKDTRMLRVMVGMMVVMRRGMRMGMMVVMRMILRCQLDRFPA